MTLEEFEDRVKALNRARRIFGNLTDGNITAAFEAYQAIFAEREREIFLTSMMKPVNSMSEQLNLYERPKCECGHDMMFRLVPDNAEGIKTQLVCTNSKCDIVLDSKYSLNEWMGILKKK